MLMLAPPIIHSLLFARSGDCLSGEMPVASLPRLVESLASESGMVRYRLCGTVVDGRPSLDLMVEAQVEMICQRCLGGYVERVQAHSVLPIARDEAQMAHWERDDPLIDVLLADPNLDVQMLVEDEILLSLPAVPRHPDGECEVAVPVGS